MKKEIKIPNSLDEIMVDQLMKFTALKSEGVDFMFDTLNIFCGLTINEARQLNSNVIEKAYHNINKALNEKPSHQKSFELDGTHYGFIPNLEQVSFGEYIDLDTYVKFKDESTLDYSQADRFMAVAYRPITKTFDKYLYEIEEYKGSDHLLNVMKKAPASVYLSAIVFFCDLSNKLLATSKAYLAEADKLVTQGEDSQRGGGGMAAFNHLRGMMYCDIQQWYNYPCQLLSQHYHIWQKSVK